MCEDNRADRSLSDSDPTVAAQLFHSNVSTVFGLVSVGADRNAYISDQASRFTRTVNKRLLDCVFPTQNQQKNCAGSESD